jgi:hypothetical protein
MQFAEGLVLLVRRWIFLFVPTALPPPSQPEPENKPTAATHEERDEAMRKALEGKEGVKATFSAAAMPESEGAHNRALDLAAAAMMFNSRIAPNEDVTRHMEQVITRYLAGPDDIAPWKTALEFQFQLAALWLRASPTKSEAREIARSICARVATVPGAPHDFQNLSRDQLESLATVVQLRLRPSGKEFRLPEPGKHAGGRGSGTTISSWQIAMEFADVLDLPMQSSYETRRPSRKKPESSSRRRGTRRKRRP